MTATINVQRNSKTEDRELNRRDLKQLIICPITGHPCEGDPARSTVVLGRAVYRHDQRKISDATVRTLPALHKAHVLIARWMSAFGGKADIARTSALLTRSGPLQATSD